MKTKIFLFLFVAVVSLLTVSCDKEKEEPLWDMLPTAIVIDVVNGNGKKLLDPSNPDNILDTDITMTHNGKTYLRLDYVGDILGIKAIGPIAFNGLQTDHDDGYHTLLIGFFYRDAATIDESEYVIHWGDGSKDVIRYSQTCQWVYNRKKKYREPYVTCRLWLNGVEISGVEPTFRQPQIQIIR